MIVLVLCFLSKGLRRKHRIRPIIQSYQADMRDHREVILPKKVGKYVSPNGLPYKLMLLFFSFITARDKINFETRTN